MLLMEHELWLHVRAQALQRMTSKEHSQRSRGIGTATFRRLPNQCEGRISLECSRLSLEHHQRTEMMIRRPLPSHLWWKIRLFLGRVWLEIRDRGLQARLEVVVRQAEALHEQTQPFGTLHLRAQAVVTVAKTPDNTRQKLKDVAAFRPTHDDSSATEAHPKHRTPKH
jgi:hypothetical protein